MSPISNAKRLLNIWGLWKLLGLPGKAAPSTNCPWREDRKPSFSINSDGTLWHDFSTGEGGDSVDFLAKATGLSNEEACRRFIELAGGDSVADLLVTQPGTSTRERKPFRLPDLHAGSQAELEHLAQLRGLTVEGLRIASEDGHLRFGNYKGEAAWFIVDKDGPVAQARRMDGEPWRGGMKALTLPGSNAGWPVGAKASYGYPNKLFCEGGPDLLAAYCFLHAEDRAGDTRPICLLGASCRVDANALELLDCSRVRFYPHADPAGREAVATWAKALAHLRATVDALALSNLSPEVGDLNDLFRAFREGGEGADLWEASHWQLLPS